MTMHPFRRRQDISHEDRLDGWLNARMSGLDETTNEPEGESLAGAAHEFHAWAEDVQGRDPAATGPADDLWNRILHEQRRGTPTRRTRDMSTTIGAPVGRMIPPQSNRTKRAQAAPPTSRAGAWFNAIAAALLVLTLGGAAYLASDGRLGFGGGGGEGGRFAAQVVSPEASPSDDRAMCDVEPLTTEEIVAIVENPNSYIPNGHFGTPPPGEEESGARDISEGLMESPRGILPRPEESRLRVPSEEEFASAREVADAYYACSVHGTHAQVWALLNPHEVQQRILMQFPVYRDPEVITEYVESIKDELVAPDPEMTVYADQSPDGHRTYSNPNLTDARVEDRRAYPMLADADMVMYIGQEYRDEDESVVAISAWDALPLQGGREDMNGGQSLILVHSLSTDRWFVQGQLSPTG